MNVRSSWEHDSYAASTSDLFWFRIPQSIEHTGYSTEEASHVASALLPGILTYGLACPVCFSHNGCALTGDVMNFFLPLLTNGTITRDNVGPHNDLLAAFPYLCPPHAARPQPTSS